MRVLLAGLFVFALLLTFVGLVGEYIEKWGHPVFLGIICVVVLFVLVGIASYISIRDRSDQMEKLPNKE